MPAGRATGGECAPRTGLFRRELDGLGPTGGIAAQHPQEPEETVKTVLAHPAPGSGGGRVVPDLGRNAADTVVRGVQGVGARSFIGVPLIWFGTSAPGSDRHTARLPRGRREVVHRRGA